MDTRHLYILFDFYPLPCTPSQPSGHHSDLLLGMHLMNYTLALFAIQFSNWRYKRWREGRAEHDE